jgi:hypothetical protein
LASDLSSLVYVAKAAPNTKEKMMLDHFNAATLATLSKDELETLLASLQAKLSATQADSDKASLQADIATVRRYLHSLSPRP